MLSIIALIGLLQAVIQGHAVISYLLLCGCRARELITDESCT